jgi:putative transposase
MHDKHQIIEEPCEGKLSCTVLKTSGIGDSLAEFNPNHQQEKILHYWRKLHCALYNAAVYNRKTQYQKFGHSVNYLEQQNCLPEFKEVWTEYKPLGSHALQATLKRVDFAFSRFFKGKAGYPKFKSSRRYGGWTYPCSSGWKAESNG